jgi:hypothetical protein
MSANPPCCICPPECVTDDSGDTCIDASCGVCLHGCPAGMRTCCREHDIPSLTTEALEETA